jgi:putative AbiEi antitoxin of type IV toxin-antitoxin system
MRNDVPGPLRDLEELQRGVVSRQQALAVGLSKDLIDSWIERGRWQRLHRGVYAVFTGNPSREAILWAAILRAGPGSALCCETAAELDGLLDRPAALIHVTVPASRRVTRLPGIVVHSRLRADLAVHPARLPPRTRIEETVLDLCDCAVSLDQALSLFTLALGRRLTTQQILLEAVARRTRLRWRDDIVPLLHPSLAGVHSLLEYLYVRDVEKAHRLPRGDRQARAIRDQHREYRDVLYDEFALTVELDGKLAHPDERRWADIRTDNAAAAGGLITLRYGFREVRLTPCVVASQVGQVLQVRGWSGKPRRCSSACPVGSAA